MTFTSSGALTNGSAVAVPNFYSSVGNISFNGTLSAGNGSAAANRSLVISAANGTVLFNDQVGQNVIDSRGSSIQTKSYSLYSDANENPYALEVEAKTIKIFGDISTFNAQQYTGSVIVGNNGSNGNVRLLLSMDPSIKVIGSINDVVAGQDTLVLRAIRLPNDPATPTISLRDVGLTTPLAGLDVLVGEQNTNLSSAPLIAEINPDRYRYVGTIDLGGSVSTTGNQLYVGNDISLTGGSTLTSRLGTIEMLTGLTTGTISGLSNTNFALGTNASLGSNLGALGANVTRIPDPVPPSAPISLLASAPIVAPNTPTSTNPINVVSSPHGMLHDQNQQLVQSMKSSEIDSSMGAGEVVVGDLTNASCDPNIDDFCGNK